MANVIRVTNFCIFAAAVDNSCRRRSMHRTHTSATTPPSNSRQRMSPPIIANAAEAIVAAAAVVEQWQQQWQPADGNSWAALCNPFTTCFTFSFFLFFFYLFFAIMSIYLNLFFVFAHSVLAVRSLLATVECTRMHIFMCLFFMNFVCLLVYVCTSSPSATVRPLLPHSAMRFYFNVFSAADICIHSCLFIDLSIHRSRPLYSATACSFVHSNWWLLLRFASLVCCCFVVQRLRFNLHTTYLRIPYLISVYYYNDYYSFWLIAAFVFRNILVNSYDWMTFVGNCFAYRMLKFTWFINCVQFVCFEISFSKKLG